MDKQSRFKGVRKEGMEKENSRLRDVEKVLKLITKNFFEQIILEVQNERK